MENVQDWISYFHEIHGLTMRLGHKAIIMTLIQVNNTRSDKQCENL